mgnify:CR=1 FL=1
MKFEFSAASKRADWRSPSPIIMLAGLVVAKLFFAVLSSVKSFCSRVVLLTVFAWKLLTELIIMSILRNRLEY